jgi:hypothetical protein
LQTAAAAGAGAAAGAFAASGTSDWDAPQFRQNFAVGATLFPHSGQNGMIDHVVTRIIIKIYEPYPKKRKN